MGARKLCAPCSHQRSEPPEHKQTKHLQANHQAHISHRRPLVGGGDDDIRRAIARTRCRLCLGRSHRRGCLYPGRTHGLNLRVNIIEDVAHPGEYQNDHCDSRDKDEQTDHTAHDIKRPCSAIPNSLLVGHAGSLPTWFTARQYIIRVRPATTTGGNDGRMGKGEG